MDPGIVARFCAPETKLHADLFLGRLPLGRAISRADAIPDCEWENTWIYNEIIGPAGGGYQSVHARLDGAGEAEAVASFCRARQAGPFGLVEMATFQAVLPHLANALDLLHRLHRVQQQNQCLQALLDQVDSGVVLVDTAAQLCFANGRAMRIISEADGLLTGPSGLLAATPAATIDCARRSSGWHNPTTEALSRAGMFDNRCGFAWNARRGARRFCCRCILSGGLARRWRSCRGLASASSLPSRMAARRSIATHWPTLSA
jgi:hypothetical protein